MPDGRPDTTNQKQTEEALRSSETRYRRLFETTQDGILILDAEAGQILDVNPFLIEMLGYSHEDFLGKKLWEIVAFKDIEASKAIFGNCREKDMSATKICRLRRKTDIQWTWNLSVMSILLIIIK